MLSPPPKPKRAKRRAPREHTANDMRQGKPRLVTDALGRIPAFVPTPDQHNAIKALASYETPPGIMADALNISLATLYKYFAKDMKEGRAHIEARIGNSVVREALAGNMTAARMWLLSWGHPNWKGAKEAASTAQAARDEGSHIKFYIPSNRRDEPEPDEGPIIEGDPLPDAGTGTDG
jgi:hypothetical protein